MGSFGNRESGREWSSGSGRNSGVVADPRSPGVIADATTYIDGNLEHPSKWEMKR